MPEMSFYNRLFPPDSEMFDYEATLRNKNKEIGQLKYEIEDLQDELNDTKEELLAVKASLEAEKKNKKMLGLDRWRLICRIAKKINQH